MACVGYFISLDPERQSVQRRACKLARGVFFCHDNTDVSLPNRRPILNEGESEFRNRMSVKFAKTQKFSYTL